MKFDCRDYIETAENENIRSSRNRFCMMYDNDLSLDSYVKEKFERLVTSTLAEINV
jgi:hypothetical protein